MKEKLLVPGAGVIDMTPPSADTQLIVQALGQLSQQLNVMSLQLDLLLRMESNETSRSDIKSRIRKADELMRAQRAAAESESESESPEGQPVPVEE